MQTIRDAARTNDPDAVKNGGPGIKLKDSKNIVKAQYEVPYLAHATMEPLNATVDVRADGVEIWGPTQVAGEIAEWAEPVIDVEDDSISVPASSVAAVLRRA